MSDKDTSRYIHTCRMGMHAALTYCIGTLFFSFPCLSHNGIRRTVKGTGWKNRTSLRTQDFSGTGLAQPLTVTEYGVIFATGKEKLTDKFLYYLLHDTHFYTRCVCLIVNKQQINFPLLFCYKSVVCDDTSTARLTTSFGRNSHSDFTDIRSYFTPL